MEHSPPNRWGRGEIFSTRPLIASEGHWAIFNADLDAVIFGESDQWSPSFEKAWPVFIDGLGMIASDESVDRIDAEERRGEDDLAEVVSGIVGDFGVVIEGIRVVAEGGDGNGVMGGELEGIGGIRRGEMGDIKVSDACEPPEGFPLWPTDEFDAGEAIRFGEGENFLESEFWENCRYKA